MSSVSKSNCIKSSNINNSNIYNTNTKISSEQQLHIVMKRLDLEKTKSKELQKKLDKIHSNKKEVLIRIQKSIISEKEKTKSKIDDLNNKIKDLYSYIEIIENSKISILKDKDNLIKIIKNLIPKTDISNECKICYHNKIDRILPCVHTYCSKCIKNMKIHNNTNCCFCREYITDVYKL